MPLLNYTTTISVEKTFFQIQSILLQRGASDILIQAKDGQPLGISFRVDTAHGNLPFRVPVNIQGIKRVLERQVSRREIPRSALREGQPERIAWRILKDWIEAQMALLETEMVTLEQIFLPYLRVRGEVTLYDHMLETGFAAAIPERAESLRE